MKRAILTAVTALALLVAGGAVAGNPNPTESQDPYWDLPDQGAAWQAYRLKKASNTLDKAQKPAAPAPHAAKG